MPLGTPGPSETGTDAATAWAVFEVFKSRKDADVARKDFCMNLRRVTGVPVPADANLSSPWFFMSAPLSAPSFLAGLSNESTSVVSVKSCFYCVTPACGLAMQSRWNGSESSRPSCFSIQQRTGTLVYLPLPQCVLTALEAIPRINDTYFFWSGQSKISTATGDWQRTLKGVFKEAGVPDGHAHRFRDTLVVELLQAGIPMAMVLGNSSIKVTEKHYSPWVKARQEQLEADVRRTWELSESGGVTCTESVNAQ
jgi:hypothetical protein